MPAAKARVVLSCKACDAKRKQACINGRETEGAEEEMRRG